MSDDTTHIIVVVGNSVLRDALLSAIAPLECAPEIIAPGALVQAELSGFNFILLETGKDVEKLVATVQQLWAKWGETGRAGLQFVTYPEAEVLSDNVVFRLWGIGPELTVIVLGWNPDDLTELKKYTHAYAQRILQWKSNPDE